MELYAALDLLRRPVAFPSISPSPPPAAPSTNPVPVSASPLMGDVVAVLEHASMSAKRLSSAPAVDASEAASAIAFLREAHQVIGSFLSQFEPWRPPPGDGAAAGDDEPMGDDWAAVVEEAEASSDVGEVEEGVGEVGVQSKHRRKRPAPPSWPTGRASDRQIVVADSVDRRLSAMDLVFQFHG